jgi:hypothetical protein
MFRWFVRQSSDDGVRNLFMRSAPGDVSVVVERRRVVSSVWGLYRWLL